VGDGTVATGSLEILGRSFACANISISPFNSIKFVAPSEPNQLPQSSSQPNPSSVFSSHYHQNVYPKLVAIDAHGNCGIFRSI
jgi:hypothetical protein